MAKKKSKAAADKGGPSTSVIVAIIAGLVFVVGIAGGVLGWTLSRGGGDSGSVSAGVSLPSWVYDPTAPKGAPAAYQFALDNPDTLAQIPCYCGCGKLDNHKSNLDCFIASRDGNDVTFDKHGVG